LNRSLIYTLTPFSHSHPNFFYLPPPLKSLAKQKLSVEKILEGNWHPLATPPPPPNYASRQSFGKAKNIFNLLVFGGAWCSSCLRLCSASRNVAGSIPDGANELILPAALWSSCRFSLLQK